ncbi:hypothetical protein [Neisseria bacilliformis]|jgi:hypothetical protein|uniref:hypothetical protein n=1 Tax=Neisseria bacilliformis TaxID=267212 RepID=UPI003C78D940
MPDLLRHACGFKFKAARQDGLNYKERVRRLGDTPYLKTRVFIRSLHKKQAASESSAKSAAKAVFPQTIHAVLPRGVG